MKLSLKRLRARAGEQVPFAEAEPLHEADFHEPIRLHTELKMDGWAEWNPGEVVTLQATLEIELDQYCSRCLRPVSHHIVHHEHTQLKGTPTPQTLPESFSYVTSDPDIDLAAMFFGLVASHLDLKPLCSADCLGICPECGADRNLDPCACHEQRGGDPRLAVLQQWLKE